VRRWVGFLVVSVWAAFSAHADEAADATQAANAFYRSYLASFEQNGDPEVFVKKSPLLTAQFKTAYFELLKKARKADPELGLGYDPIISGQDAPENGYRVKSLQLKPDGAHAVMFSRESGFAANPIRVWLVPRDGQWLINGVNDLAGK